MKYFLIKQLVELAEQFETEQAGAQEPSLGNFTAWLNQKIAGSSKMVPGMPGPVFARGETVESVISKFITFMYRYARMYTKKALENSPLITFDDFTYLVMLYTRGSMTKMELIEQNVHEKTSGMEIIKRLLNKGLVEQYDDEHDKRSKRLSITPEGKTAIERAFPNMGKVASIVTGNLTVEEQMQLVYLLNKLHLYHNPIYLKEKQIEW